MNAFVRATELWVPSKGKATLEYGGGLYGDLAEFKAASVQKTFSFDQGLPGKAWACRHPVVLKEFKNSYFARTDEAIAAGLTCGVAIPVFDQYAIKAVLVLLCSDSANSIGAIEVWTNDPSVSDRISLFDGYFGATSEFEEATQDVSFERGQGLPGLVWEQDIPVLINELNTPGPFLRWKNARKSGLNVGLGFPCSYEPARTWITTLISGTKTPIARRFEIWLPVNDGLNFHFGSCDRNPDYSHDYQTNWINHGEGFIGKTLATGTPQITENFLTEPKWLRVSAQMAGLTAGVAMPVLDHKGATSAVITWYV